MDIHRCRFVPYPTSTINSLAFSYSQGIKGENPGDLRLAIGRANGNIEIWNPLNGAWLQETILRGGKDRSIDGLVWIRDPGEQDTAGKRLPGRLRLFSIGYTTTVTEWDLERGQPLRQSSGNHGEIWCLASQPSLLPSATQLNGNTPLESLPLQSLVTGCTDGAVVLYSTADQDLKLQRVLARPSSRKAKVVSVVFQNRNVVVAGYSDSTIRIYDVRTGTLVRSMSLGAGPTSGPKEIIVWAVKCLPNGNILSGDSSGELRIWDGKTYTLLQRIKSHKQDTLSLVTSIDGTMIFSGGMDRRTVVYKQVGGLKSRWGEITHRRFHSHDVKTMATFEGMGMSIIASGGPDGNPIILPLREFGSEYQRMLPCLPQEPAVQSSPTKRLLMSWWDREISLWRIEKTSNPQHGVSDSDSEVEYDGQSRKLVAKLVVKGEASISSASIASNGSLLAVSTSAEIKLFRLYAQHPAGSDAVKIKKVELPTSISGRGARLLQFSPDGHWLAVVQRDNRVIAIRILDSGKNLLNIHHTLSHLVRMGRVEKNRVHRSGLGAYDRTITRVAFSSDSRILAVSDLAGYIDTWALYGLEDLASVANEDDMANDASFNSSPDGSDTGDEEELESTKVLGQHWQRNPCASLLPRLPSAAVILCFRPSHLLARRDLSNNPTIVHATRNNPFPNANDLPHGEDRLIVVPASGGVMEFEVMQGALSAWSRRNPASSFPEEFNRLLDHAMGCIWDTGKSKERLWIYGSSWMWMFDLSRDFTVKTSQQSSAVNGHVDGEFSDTIESRPNKRSKRNGSSQLAIIDPKLATSGAGGTVSESELIGISRRDETIAREEGGKVVANATSYRQKLSDSHPGGSYEEMVDYDVNTALIRLRRDDDASLAHGIRQATKKGSDDDDGSAHWWHTYKYRPILGVVPLGNGEAGLEVALVERPTWEMELPPKYYGDQEWEKPGI